MTSYAIVSHMTQAAFIGEGDWVPGIGFGDRLRVVRRKRHRTQNEMADRLGVKKVTYASWEASGATPPHEEVLRVARKLYQLERVPTWWTLGADDPDTLGGRTRSSTDRASDYGSQIERSARPFRRRPQRRRATDQPGRHLRVVPTIYAERMTA